MLFLVILVSLLYPTLVFSQCVYTLPVGPSSKQCARFDLTLLAHYGPYNISAGDGTFEKLYVKVCDVITVDMPDVCVSKKPSPAYKYLHECQILGDILRSYAFPLDPLNISKGISIAYSGGEGGVSGYWPTAVVYDLHCDRSGVSRLPTVSYEWPPSTFRVMWKTGYACPQIISSKACTRPIPPKSWDGLRFRNSPPWYNNTDFWLPERAKFGILVTWGVFSVPAFGNESYWWNLENGDPDTVRYHNKVFGCSGVEPDKYPCVGPKFKYQDFAPMFKAEYFDPDHWASLFRKAGAQYVVLTTKYHTGWCNFPSKNYKNWNSVDNGPHVDITGKLTDSVRKMGLKMGFYHSLNEWYNPILEKDLKNNCSTTKYPDKILIPTLKQLVEKYKPDLLLSDGIETGNCSQDSTQYLKSDSFLYWLYNESPVKDTVITNSNWGVKSFGSYYGDDLRDTSYRKYEWEFPFGIQNDSFGFNYKYKLADVRNATEILWQLTKTVSNNGKFLLNVGPMANGTIHPMFEEILLDIGKWMAVNGIAVLFAIPWKYQTDSSNNSLVLYTASVNMVLCMLNSAIITVHFIKDWYTVYAVIFSPLIPGGTLKLQKPIATPSKTQVYFLAKEAEVPVSYKSMKNGGIELTMPNFVPETVPWTLEMTYVT